MRTTASQRLLSLSLALVLLLGGSTGPGVFAADDSIEQDSQLKPAVGPSQSSTIAISRDDRLLVNVNPDANSVSLFRVRTEDEDDNDDQNRETWADAIVSNTASIQGELGRWRNRDRFREKLEKIDEIDVGKDPSSVAIHPTRKLAYVTNSFDGTLSVVSLRNKRTVSEIKVGTEPSAVAVSPNGTRLYVANSASNSITVLDATRRNLKVLTEIELDQYGTAPRAIAITNNGDKNDADETVFAALFFGQLRPGKSSLEEGQDDQREGRVVAISAANNQVLAAPNPITLRPIDDAGFNSNGRLAPGTVVNNVATAAIPSTNPQTFTTPTGAFPNQLAAVAIQPSHSRAYVVSTGASPNGPLRFNQMAQGLVSVFNTLARTEITSGQVGPVRRTAPLNLDQGINLDTALVPRLFLTNPVAMAWRPDGSDAWIAIQHSDLLVRLTVDANGIPTIGAPLAAGPGQIVRVDLENAAGDRIAGKAPRGVAINNAGTRAFVFNFISRSITAVDITNATAPTIVQTARASHIPESAWKRWTVNVEESNRSGVCSEPLFPENT